MPVVILAGGLATRMRPLTDSTPKSLLPIGGKPFIWYQLQRLKKDGVRDAVICVGYLGDMVIDYLKGAKIGMSISFSSDWPEMLGTGGAIKKALPVLPDQFMVLYGDSYLDINYATVASHFETCGKRALTTVYRNKEGYDKSNIVFENGLVREYRKGAANLDWIDYGLSVFDKNIFAETPDGPFDLGDLVSALAGRGDLAGLEASKPYHEIGSQAGYQRFQAYIEGRHWDA